MQDQMTNIFPTVKPLSIFEETLINLKKEIPDIEVRYKDKSLFMKLLGIILFFNPAFMKSFITTIGSTIYYANEAYTREQPVGATVVLLHEATHILESKRKNGFIFSLSYLFPQLLFLLSIPMFFVCGFYSFLFLIFLLPLPAPFRMMIERNGYTTSLYIMHLLKLKGYGYDLDLAVPWVVSQFKTSAYYWMWVFPSIDQYFKNVVGDLKNGKTTYVDKGVVSLVSKVLI